MILSLLRYYFLTPALFFSSGDCMKSPIWFFLNLFGCWRKNEYFVQDFSKKNCRSRILLYHFEIRHFHSIDVCTPYSTSSVVPIYFSNGISNCQASYVYEKLFHWLLSEPFSRGLWVPVHISILRANSWSLPREILALSLRQQLEALKQELSHCDCRRQTE